VTRARIVLLLLVVACARKEAAPSVPILAGASLRDTFNADADRVRLVVLAAPS
jgi:hypothetical protein